MINVFGETMLTINPLFLLEVGLPVGLVQETVLGQQATLFGQMVLQVGNFIFC